MSAFVPASTPVKRNRVRNIDTDRLDRRRLFLLEVLNSSYQGTRIDFAYRAAEMHAIENELEGRGIEISRVTNQVEGT